MSLDPVYVSVHASAEPSPPGRQRWIRRWGIIAVALSVVALALEVVAIAIGSGGSWGAATILAWFVIGLFALAITLGVVAILACSGRAFGIAAVALTLVANPLTLVGVFGLLGSRG